MDARELSIRILLTMAVLLCKLSILFAARGIACLGAPAQPHSARSIPSIIAGRRGSWMFFWFSTQVLETTMDAMYSCASIPLAGKRCRSSAQVLDTTACTSSRQGTPDPHSLESRHLAHLAASSG